MSEASNLCPAHDEISSDFTFVWKISNLSYCMLRNEANMTSPKFKFSNYTWELLFYPRKNNPISSAQCDLNNCVTYNANKFIGKFVCHLCVCSTSQELYREVREVNLTTQTHMQHLASFGREIFEKLPDNAIVLYCHLGKPGPINSVKHPLHIFAETRISLRRNIFYLKIEKFSYLQLDKETNYSFSTQSDIYPSLTLKAFLLGTNLKDAAVQIWLIFVGLSVPTFSSCGLCLNDTNERTLKCIKQDGWLGSIENIIKISFMREEIFAWELPNDTIILRGEVTLSGDNGGLEQVVYNMETKEAVAAVTSNGLLGTQTKSLPVPLSASENRPSALSADMLSLFKGNGPPSDFELRVEGRSFPVHRVVLGARSTVFRTMFASDMLERSEKSLELPDISADTAERMLRYVYTDEEPSSELDWESVADLYAAADKYALIGLRTICGDRLVQALDVANVPRVLQTADRHRDHLLKKHVVDFVIEQGPRAVESENWKKLEDADPKLAVEVLRQIMKQKWL